MSKNDMLAPIVRALVGAPQERLGVVLDIANRIGSADGELWRTRFAEVLREGVRTEPLPPEVPLDTVICVDRSIRPVYPEWVKTVVHPELESTGPAEYDLGTIDLWLHPEQKNSCIEGFRIYEYMGKRRMLEGCLSLRDGEEIQKKDPAVFQKFFGGKLVYLWKSIVQDRAGHLHVPFLTGDDDGVWGDWYRLDHSLVGREQALRFVGRDILRFAR